MAQYIPKYFKITELVNPDLLKKYGESKCWLLFDPQLLKAADAIREKYGPCTVNGSGLVDCGLRNFESKTGAALSAHKFGRALDLHILNIENAAAKNNDLAARNIEKITAYNAVRKELLNLPGFECLNFENNISWLHIDTFNRPARLFNA